MPVSSASASTNSRRTPVGFIPQLDRGYLIIVTQLPPAASLTRTDEVNRRAVEIALKVPGIAHAVNIVGFSGATFTNAPNAGAIFVTLDDFEKRAADPRQSAAGIQMELFKRLAAIQEGLIFVAAPPPVSGIGNAGGFRMMVEDRGGLGYQALQGAAYAMMGRAAQTPGLCPGLYAVRKHDTAALSRHRSHQGAAARHQYP